MTEPISGMVLAGGKSRRLGADKTRLILAGGRSLLQASVDLLNQVVQEVLVVVGAESETEVTGARIVHDVYPDKGSLGGIYSGLLSCQHEHCLVVGCDMPFLNVGFLKWMVERPRDYDVLIPRLDGHLEPLHAIYSKRCLPHMRALLDQGDLKILDFFDQVVVKYVEADEVDRWDPERLSFFNVNTPENLARAREIIARRGEGTGD